MPELRCARSGLHSLPQSACSNCSLSRWRERAGVRVVYEIHDVRCIPLILTFSPGGEGTLKTRYVSHQTADLS